MSRMVCFVGFAFLLPLQFLAQSVVQGTTFSDTTVLPGVSININGRQMISDSAGRFYFEGKAARYLIIATASGHQLLRLPFQLKEREVKKLDLMLEPLIAEMDAVVVTGTMKAVKKLDSPIPVEVYNAQFFKKDPSPSLFESMQHINGVRPQINCSVCNTGDIHINGLEGPYTMVTIDGMPIVSSLSSVYGLFGIPSSLIDRVEIVKGPASGLYGAEAIGGLINIITRSPSASPRFTAKIMSTSWLEHTADLGYRWKAFRKLDVLTGIHYFNYQHPSDKNKDGFTDVTLQHRVSVFNKWSLQRSQSKTATLAVRYFGEDRWGGENRWEPRFRGTDLVYGESIRTHRWELTGNYQLPFADKTFLQLSATSHKQDSYYGIKPYNATQKIGFVQLVHHFQWKNQELMAGVSSRAQFYDDNSTATVDTLTHRNQPERYVIPGVFLQDEWKPAAKHRFLAGIRLDRHEAHGFIFTPRLAYQWQPQTNQTVRLNAGTGFRVVNIFTEEHAALTGARAVRILDHLRPEKSYNVNLNYVWSFGKTSQRWNLDFSTWYSYFSNKIIPNYETDPNLIIYANLDGYALSRGTSLNVEANLLNRLKLWGGITLQDLKKVESAVSGKRKHRPLLTEKWSGTWSVTYSLPVAGLTFDYTGNIYGPMKLPLGSALDPRRAYSPAWSIQNIQLTKTVGTRTEFFCGIKNLLNWTPAKNNPFLIARTHDPFDKLVEYDASGQIRSTPENPYALSFDPSYIYAPNQGIRFFGGLSFQWKD